MSSLTFDQMNNISQFLEIPSTDHSVFDRLTKKFPKASDQQALATDLYQFLKYFDMFRNLKELLKVLKDTILSTFDLAESVSDYKEGLLKSILLRIIEIYIDYAKYSDKDKILKTLSQSLEILAPSALIINLGLMVKPVFTDAAYLETRQKEEAVLIVAVNASEVGLKIKAEIDKWIKMQQLNVDFQDEIRANLCIEFDKVAQKFNFDKSRKEYSQIKNECIEMLNMQLTMLSLTMEIGDEDLSPQPIQL